MTFGFLFIRSFQKPVWVLPIHNPVAFISDLSSSINGILYFNSPFLVFIIYLLIFYKQLACTSLEAVVSSNTL